MYVSRMDGSSYQYLERFWAAVRKLRISRIGLELSAMEKVCRLSRQP
jgi:hypothetical protein